MELDFFWLAAGLAVAAYFIGDGLKNFKNPNGKSMVEVWSGYGDMGLVHEKYVHDILGIDQKDAQQLTKDHPDIPHIVINSNVYYPKKRLLEWVEEIGKERSKI
ncbi:DNA-binding protein [Salipaludibacillus keqinensis]|uniref:DNA-binding protein n=1 Tax=Salipaludibacillus keqinensis TaxID=2045207 RepID=A0A323TLG3_9BACI|nr:DNA-binding protein [Salipaludibacillus keqinensis]PYZ94784.1 DNA-binding protein [Salipaludibacillus keqinensis]